MSKAVDKPKLQVIANELRTINISEEQLYWLLRGFNIKVIKAHDYIEFDSVFSTVEMGCQYEKGR